MPLNNIEFFSYEKEIWYRTPEGNVGRLTETDFEMVREVADFIALFYPKAYEALTDEYKQCALNVSYQRYRIVARFIRCNFAELDGIPDISSDLHCNFETVNCPLRGECRLDHVVCHPEFAHQMSPAEMRVMRLWYEGLSEPEIGERLHLSPYTVHNHIRNAYARISVRDKSQFVKYATLHKLFE